MELNKSGTSIIDEELKEESAWTEFDLSRRKILRAAFGKGKIALLILDIRHPRISIKPPQGGPCPFFARPLGLQQGETLPDPGNHRDSFGVVGLDQEKDPANRLELIASQLPSFIESFYYTQRVPIKIYVSHDDIRKEEPAATVTPGKSGEITKVEIDRSKLEPFYTNPEGN